MDRPTQVYPHQLQRRSGHQDDRVARPRATPPSWLFGLVAGPPHLATRPRSRPDVLEMEE